MNKRGYTLMEIMVGVIGMSLLLLLVVKLFSQTANFFRRNQVRNQLQQDAQTAMNALLHFSREGDANTVAISSSIPCSGAPLAQLEFDTADLAKTHYKFYEDCSNPQVPTLQMVVTPKGAASNAPTSLAKNVSLVRFFPSMTSDLSILNIALTLQSNVDATRTESVALTSQVILKQNPSGG